jgi:hypothetical protein
MLPMLRRQVKCLLYYLQFKYITQFAQLLSTVSQAVALIPPAAALVAYTKYDAPFIQYTCNSSGLEFISDSLSKRNR